MNILERARGATAVVFFAVPMVLGFNECQKASPDPVCSVDCAGGEVIICGNVCATPIEEGKECEVDACSKGSLCEEGLTCVGNPGTGYSCEDLGGVLFAECDYAGYGPGDDDCANHLYCRANLACGATDDFFEKDRCAAPTVDEGTPCDSDLDDPLCYPCTAGLTCVGTSATSYGDEPDGACLRTCSVDEDCACASGQPGECLEGLCAACREVGQSCNAFKVCCDEGAECSKPTATGMQCCMTESKPCEVTADCCPFSGDEATCAPAEQNGSRVCQKCVADGNSCVDDEQCCGSQSDCINNVCQVGCTQNEPCEVPGQLGLCHFGVRFCTGGTLGACTQTVQPVIEFCNGLDDDCDGVADEDIAPTNCATANAFINKYGNSTTCESGFQSDGGSGICINGAILCVAHEPEHFCKLPGAGCGKQVGDPCSTSLECSPNLTCQGLPGTCQWNSSACPYQTPGSLGHCWTQDDVGTCANL